MTRYALTAQDSRRRERDAFPTLTPISTLAVLRISHFPSIAYLFYHFLPTIFHFAMYHVSMMSIILFFSLVQTRGRCFTSPSPPLGYVTVGVGVVRCPTNWADDMMLGFFFPRRALATREGRRRG